MPYKYHEKINAYTVSCTRGLVKLLEDIKSGLIIPENVNITDFYIHEKLAKRIADVILKAKQVKNIRVFSRPHNPNAYEILKTANNSSKEPKKIKYDLSYDHVSKDVLFNSIFLLPSDMVQCVLENLSTDLVVTMFSLARLKMSEDMIKSKRKEIAEKSSYKSLNSIDIQLLADFIICCKRVIKSRYLDSFKVKDVYIYGEITILQTSNALYSFSEQNNQLVKVTSATSESTASIHSMGNTLIVQTESSIHKFTKGVQSEPVIEYEGDNIRSYSAGEESQLLLTNDQLLARGRNHYGELGLGDSNPRDTFVSVTLPQEINVDQIIKVLTGKHSSYILTQNGIFACGGNYFGQLGLGDVGEEYYNFQRLQIPDDIQNHEIIDIISGAEHFIVHTQRGIYACGNNSDERAVPHIINDQLNSLERLILPHDLNIEDIIKITSGYNHSIIHTKNGVYGWGCNSSGQLGLSAAPNRVCKIEFNFDIKDARANRSATVINSNIVLGDISSKVPGTKYYHEDNENEGITSRAIRDSITNELEKARPVGLFTSLYRSVLQQAKSIDFSEVTNNIPLIRYMCP